MLGLLRDVVLDCQGRLFSEYLDAGGHLAQTHGGEGRPADHGRPGVFGEVSRLDHDQLGEALACCFAVACCGRGALHDGADTVIGQAGVVLGQVSKSAAPHPDGEQQSEQRQRQKEAGIILFDIEVPLGYRRVGFTGPEHGRRETGRRSHKGFFEGHTIYVASYCLCLFKQTAWCLLSHIWKIYLYEIFMAYVCILYTFL